MINDEEETEVFVWTRKNTAILPQVQCPADPGFLGIVEIAHLDDYYKTNPYI